jgi:predicted component of type VI protein secretion system
MNKFALGVGTGIVSLAVAIPVIAQVSLAASSDNAAANTSGKTRPIPTQACVQALATKEGSALSSMDAMNAARKAALQAHNDALDVAASITDDTARQAALKAANDALREAMKASMESQKDSMKSSMDAIKSACGDSMPMMFGRGPMKGHHPHGNFMMKHHMEPDGDDANASSEKAQ